MASIILLVDDNPIQAATRQAILSSSVNEVLVATSASRALALLEDSELAANVRLVITDHLMPGMTGPQFVARLREGFPVLPVLVLSGWPDVEMEYAGLNILYRSKPIAPEELIPLVELLCRDALKRTA